MHSNSIREQILQAILAILKPVVEDIGGALFRSPVIPIERDQTPAIIVFPEEEIADSQNTITKRRLTVRVVALARVANENDAEIVADQLMVAVHAALMENFNLGGLCQKITELGTEWEIEDADARAVAIPARYAIDYRTHFKDLTLKA